MPSSNVCPCDSSTIILKLRHMKLRTSVPGHTNISSLGLRLELLDHTKCETHLKRVPMFTLAGRKGSFCSKDVKSPAMKSICLHVYLWSDAVTPSWPVGTWGLPAPCCEAVVQPALPPGPDLYTRERTGKMQRPS